MRDWKEFFLEYDKDYKDLLFIKKAYEAFYEYLSIILISIFMYIIFLTFILFYYIIVSTEGFFPFSNSLGFDFLMLQVFPITSFFYLYILVNHFKNLKNNNYMARILGKDLSFRKIIKQLEVCKEISDGYNSKYEEALRTKEAIDILNKMRDNQEIKNI